jgi:hypothetical protein
MMKACRAFSIVAALLYASSGTVEDNSLYSRRITSSRRSRSTAISSRCCLRPGTAKFLKWPSNILLADAYALQAFLSRIDKTCWDTNRDGSPATNRQLN